MTRILFPEERRQEIVRILAEHPRVTVTELSRKFTVSEVTIRKDLTFLEEQGSIQRMHGGAIGTGQQQDDLGFDRRAQIQQAEKERIALAASQLVSNGDSIALDASTTSLYLARRLREHRELTVVTNGIRNAIELANRRGTTVLVPGGTFRLDTYSLVGNWGEAVLRQINIQRAFVGAKGFTLEEGLTDANADEVKLKQAIVGTAKDVIALIDHTKWGQVAFATFCQLPKLKLIITDAKAPAEMVEQVRRKGIEVRVV